MKKIPVLLAVLVITAIAVRLASPLESYDIWWHMLLGKTILSTGQMIPDHSLFTWTPANAYAIYNSWLAQTLLYWIYEQSGATGLVILRYVVYITALLLCLQFAYRKGVLSSPLSWLIILVGFNFLAGGNVIKPEIFTVLFSSLTVWVFFSYREFDRYSNLLPYLLPVVLLLWINMHGAFFIISLFFAATVVGDLLNRKFSPSLTLSPVKRKHYYIALGLCIPVLFLNPFGYELPMHIVKSILGMAPKYDVRTYGFRPTSEFNAPPYYLLDYLILAMTVFFGLTLVLIKKKRIDWVSIILFIGYAALFVKFVRLTYFLGPVFIFVSLTMLGDIKNTNNFTQYKKAGMILALVSVILIALSSWNIISARQCFLESDSWSLSGSPNQPVADTEYIKNHLKGTRVGNLYNDGGYMAFQLWPEKKVTIDTRNFPFLDWANEYFDFSVGKNIPEFLEKYRADFWYIRYSYPQPYRWFVESGDWDLIYFGTKGSVFVPSNTSHDQSISEELVRIDNVNDLLLIMNSAFMLDDLSIAEKVSQMAISTLGQGCDVELSDKIKKEMGTLLEIHKLSRAGKLENAYHLLTEEMDYLQDKNHLLELLERLMIQNMDSGNTQAAREWGLKLLAYSKDAVDIYNFMLIDWNYRHLNPATDALPQNSLHWKKLAHALLQHRQALAEKQPQILSVVENIHDGTFNGNARLIANHHKPRSAEKTR